MADLREDLALLDRGDLLDEEETEETATGPQPGPRGWARRGGGQVSYVQAPVRWRGTSVQVNGMWPGAVGSSAPLVGAPLGRIMAGRSSAGATLCSDPLTWFVYGLIGRPSAYMESEPGIGKSTVARRMALALDGFGVNTLVLGDLKPDYVNLVRALGGQVIALGPGRGNLNILDNTLALAAAERLSGNARAIVLADAHARRTTMVSALLAILRRRSPEDREESIIDRAIRVLDDKHDGVPVLPDLLTVIRDAPEEVRAVAIDRGSIDRYREITEGLEASLMGLVGHGRLGETFCKPTTEPMRWDCPVAFDISGIDDGQLELQAATLMACWSTGFGMVNVATALAEAGVEPERHYFVILDELWRAIRSGAGMVDRIDALTRLDRDTGVGQLMITHTLADLAALSEIDRMKAKGFIERAGMVICGGLPRSEMPLLADAVGMSAAEQQLLTSWGSPAAWDTQGRMVPPPGRGNFLVKVGGRPGIPFHVELTEAELALNDTNHRWREWAARAQGRQA
jgi:hypothetical protein